MLRLRLAKVPLPTDWIYVTAVAYNLQEHWILAITHTHTHAHTHTHTHIYMCVYLIGVSIGQRKGSYIDRYPTISNIDCYLLPYSKLH
jgi:hypothetical protein